MDNESVEKKKRGRKPNPDKVPKKRGRKPKLSQDISTIVEKTYKTKKKTKQTSYGISDSQTDTESKTENIILHLPVHTDEIDSGNQQNLPEEMNTTGLKNTNATWIGKRDSELNETGTNFSFYPFNKDNKNNEIMDVLEDTPCFPEHSGKPINNTQSTPPQNQWILNGDVNVNHVDNWNNPFQNQNENPLDNNNYTEYINSLNNPRVKDLQFSSSFDYHKKTDLLMRQFIEANSRKEWPASTPIHCFWCCHPFETKPCGLPLEYKNETYHVYGCFCSPECAAAYNFNDFQDTDKRWERYSLLNRLYKKRELPNSKIKLAPPRQTLQIFGGPLSIIQFRKTLETYDKTYVLNFPPMTSINVQQEQVNFDTSQFNKKDMSLFIPVDHDRISEASENLKLKRKKPISETTNTLENCMNLQFK